MHCKFGSEHLFYLIGIFKGRGSSGLLLADSPGLLLAARLEPVTALVHLDATTSSVHGRTASGLPVLETTEGRLISVHVDGVLSEVGSTGPDLRVLCHLCKNITSFWKTREGKVS